MNQKLKILHLEDMPTDAELVSRMLKKGGIECEILVADTKAKYIAALQNFTPDIILSDHSLPSFDSHEALEIYKSTGLKIPFILITATVSEEFAVEIMKAGVNDYLLKDRLERLPSAVTNSLETFRMENERKNYIETIIANENLMKKAEHLARFGSWQVNLLQNTTKWSDETFRMFGYEPGEIEPDYQKFFDHIHPDDVTSVKIDHNEAVMNLKPKKSDFRIVDKNGKLRYIHSELVIESNDRKEAISITGFNQDVTKEKIAEKKLEQSEIHYRSLINNITDCIILINENAETIYQSPSVERVTGYSIRDKKEKSFFNFIHRDDLQDCIQLFHQVNTQPGVPVQWENRILHKQGYYIHVEGTILNLLHDESVNAFIVNYRDITGRKAAEEELQRKQYLLSEAQRIAQLGSWEIDLLTGKTSWSDEMYKIYGLQPHTVSAVTDEWYTNVVHPDDLESLQQWRNDFIVYGKKVKDLDFRILLSNGNERIIRGSSEIFYSDAGRPIRAFGTAQDITERKKNEEKLRKSYAEIQSAAERQSAIINSLNAHIALLDESGVIIQVNEAWKIFADKNQKISGKYFIGDKYIHASENATGEDASAGKAIAQAIRDVLAGKLGEFSLEYPCHTSISGEGWYRANVTPLYQNKHGGAVVSHTNITERKKAELEMQELVNILQKKNKDLQQFSYIVSHNLRSPIANILGLIGLFEKSPDDNTINNSLLEFVSNEATNLDNVIKDINTIITVRDSENQIKEYVIFEVELELIKHVLESEILANNAQITVDFKEAIGVVTIKSYLYSIIYNLLSNAIKYRSHDRLLRIHIQTKLVNNFVCLFVKDNGSGIDMQRNGEKIFGLYKRFHNNAIPGKGMGLNMVKVQAESLGGNVEVESKPNQGTTFKVYFPK